MPTYTTTAKHALRWLTGANVSSDIDAGFQALAEDLDGKIATASSGLLAARPVSTGGSPGKLGRWFYATDTGQFFFDYGTGWIDSLARPTFVTALPTTNLYDGQIVHYQTAAMAADSIFWSFRYRAASASTYKWECIGGRPLIGFNAATVTTPLSVYQDLGGPDVITPLAGEYNWDIFVNCTYDSVFSGTPGTPGMQVIVKEPAFGGTFGITIGSIPGTIGRYGILSSYGVANLLDTTYRMWYLATASGAGNPNIGFFNRTVRLMPIRVL